MAIEGSKVTLKFLKDTNQHYAHVKGGIFSSPALEAKKLNMIA